jgi:uncharacterized OB-fold protein
MGALVTEPTSVVPLVDYLVLGDSPHLVANACEGCEALYFDRRNACARCGGRSFLRRPLGTKGTVTSFTIVHRAAPGVPAPFASAVIELDGGGVVKANVTIPEGTPSPGNVRCGLEVEMVTFDVATDAAGTQAIGFAFAPIGGGRPA